MEEKSTNLVNSKFMETIVNELNLKKINGVKIETCMSSDEGAVINEEELGSLKEAVIETHSFAVNDLIKDVEGVEEDDNDDNESDNDSKKSDSDYTQWSCVKGECIVPVASTFKMLDAGYYTIEYNDNIGMYFLKHNVEMNKLYRLPNNATDIVMNDISKFWTLENTYKKYNRVFRRNYLLYSAPGTGKTSLINLMCQDLIKDYNGIVFSLTYRDDIKRFPDAVRRIRKIEPNRKIIAVIEDIDNFISQEGGSSSMDTYVLNLLDGNFRLSGVVTIATTNFIERIESRYKNRPSRFDRVVEFPLPNKESRKMFIEKTILPDDLSKINIDEWVKKTEGFTIDHINELILLYFVFGHTEEESFDSITTMVKKNNRLKNKTSVNRTELGFDNG